MPKGREISLPETRVALELRGQGADLWGLCENPFMIKGVVVHTEPDYVVEGGEIRPVLERVSVTGDSRLRCEVCSATFNKAHGLKCWSKQCGMLALTQCTLCGSYTWVDLGPKSGESPEQFVLRIKEEALSQIESGQQDALKYLALSNLLSRLDTTEKQFNAVEEHLKGG